MRDVTTAAEDATLFPSNSPRKACSLEKVKGYTESTTRTQPYCQAQFPRLSANHVGIEVQLTDPVIHFSISFHCDIAIIGSHNYR